MKAVRDSVLFGTLKDLQYKINTELHILSMSCRILQYLVSVCFSSLILYGCPSFPLLKPCSTCFNSSMVRYFLPQGLCISALTASSSKSQHKCNLPQQGYSGPPNSSQPLSHSLSYLLLCLALMSVSYFPCLFFYQVSTSLNSKLYETGFYLSCFHCTSRAFKTAQHIVVSHLIFVE